MSNERMNNSVERKKAIRQPFDGEKKLYELVRVRFLHSGRLCEVNVANKRLMPKMLVVVRVRRNTLIAEVIGHRYRGVAEVNSLPYVLRIATDEDIQIDRESFQIEKKALSLATEFAFDQKLTMKVLGAELSIDRKMVTINFASDVRVDFRKMVTFLVQNLNIRVEMYQLGLRNGSGLLCGIGTCGQRLCCGRFLEQFDPVSVKLLRAQGLVTNPKRISGVCGRLFCCLSYEYRENPTRQILPKKGTPALTRWGLGKIVDQDLIREELLVLLDNGETQRVTLSDLILDPKPEDIPETFPLERAKLYLNHDPASAVILKEIEPAQNPRASRLSRAIQRVRKEDKSNTQENQKIDKNKPKSAKNKSTSPKKRINNTPPTNTNTKSQKNTPEPHKKPTQLAEPHKKPTQLAEPHKKPTQLAEPHKKPTQSAETNKNPIPLMHPIPQAESIKIPKPNNKLEEPTKKPQIPDSHKKLLTNSLLPSARKPTQIKPLNIGSLPISKKKQEESKKLKDE